MVPAVCKHNSPELMMRLASEDAMRLVKERCSTELHCTSSSPLRAPKTTRETGAEVVTL